MEVNASPLKHYLFQFMFGCLIAISPFSHQNALAQIIDAEKEQREGRIILNDASRDFINPSKQAQNVGKLVKKSVGFWRGVMNAFGIRNGDPSFIIPLNKKLTKLPTYVLSKSRPSLQLSKDETLWLYTPTGWLKQVLNGSEILDGAALKEGMYRIRYKNGDRDLFAHLLVDRTPPAFQVGALQFDNKSHLFKASFRTTEKKWLMRIRAWLPKQKAYKTLLPSKTYTRSKTGLHRLQFRATELLNQPHTLWLEAVDTAKNFTRKKLTWKSPNNNTLSLAIHDLSVQSQSSALPGKASMARHDIWPPLLDDTFPSGSTHKGKLKWDTRQVFSGQKSLVLQAAKGSVQVATIRHLSNIPTLSRREQLIQYVYLDPKSPPKAILLGYYVGNDGEHRAVYGQKGIDLGGKAGTASHRRIGNLPSTGGWYRLRIPTHLLALENKQITGLVFAVLGGKAYFDKTTRSLPNSEPNTKGIHKVPPLQDTMKNRSGLSIRYHLSRSCQVTLHITHQKNKKFRARIPLGVQSPGPQVFFWNAKYSNGKFFPDGRYHIKVEAHAKQKVVTSVTTGHLKSLVARIYIPGKMGALVRATLPIFGDAGGRSFAYYTLDYGQGSAPKQWKRITKRKRPSVWDQKKPPREKTLFGNLGSLDTGFAAYKYPFHPHLHGRGLQGRYTIRLKVFDKHGAYTEAKRQIIVGQVIANILGGLLGSPDGKAQLHIAPLSLKKGLEVLALVPSQATPPLPKTMKLASKVYTLYPSNLTFGTPAKLSFALSPSKNPKKAASLAIAEYNSIWKRWRLIRQHKTTDNRLQASLQNTGYTRRQYALVDTTLTPPKPKNNTSNKAWRAGLQTRYQGARIHTLAGHPKGVRLEPFEGEGNRDISVDLKENLPKSLQKTPVLSFKVRFPLSRTRKTNGFHIFLQVDEKRYNIIVRTKQRLGRTLHMTRHIGESVVPNDGKWHRVWIPLRTWLHPHVSPNAKLSLQKLTFGHWKRTGHKAIAPKTQLEWLDLSKVQLHAPQDKQGPMAHSPTPTQKQTSSMLSCRLHDTFPGVGIDPTSIQLRINQTTITANSSGLSYNPVSGKLQGNISMLLGKLKKPIKDKDWLSLTLLQAKDWAGNKLQKPLQWKFQLNRRQKQRGLPNAKRIFRLTKGGGQMPTFSPVSQKIAYVVPQATGSDIWEYNLKTKKKRRLTLLPGNEAEPAYGPKGEWLVFTYQPKSAGPRQLYAKNLHSGTTRKLVDGLFDVSNPHFARGTRDKVLFSSGGRVYFVRISAHGIPTLVTELPTGLLQHPNSSDSGSELFGQQSLYGERIVRVNRFTQEVKHLTSGPADRHPKLSPDGRWLAFTRPQGLGRAIYFLKASTPSSQKKLSPKRFDRSKVLGPLLPSMGRFDTRPSFSKDGRWMVFESTRGAATTEVYVGEFSKNIFHKKRVPPKKIKLAQHVKNCKSNRILGDRLSSKRTLSIHCSPYRVARSLYLEQGGLLTIPAGVHILFDHSTGIYVRGGRLISKGTATHPVVFTSALVKPKQGSWNGIHFEQYSKKSHSIFQYTRVLYGGQDRKGGCITFAHYLPKRSVQLTNTHFGYCLGAGLVAHRNVFKAIQKLSFEGKGTVGLRVHSSIVGHIRKAFSYKGIRSNEILSGHINNRYYSAKIIRSATWVAQGVPWDLRGDLIVGHANHHPTLTLQPGTTLRFYKGGLQVGIWEHGRLIAKGRPYQPITFTIVPTRQEKGNRPAKRRVWNGIRFGRKTLPGSELNDVLIYHAGNSSFVHSRGCITVERNNRKAVSITGTHFFNCGKSGLYAEQHSLKKLKELYFSNIRGAGLTLHPDSVGAIQNKFTYKNTRYNRIISNAINSRFHSRRVTESASWIAQGIPWRVYGDIMLGHARKQPILTILPGVQLQFTRGGLQVGVHYQGTLKVVGTEKAPVVFEGLPIKKTNSNVPKAIWNGIHFGARALPGSMMQHAVIKNAGMRHFHYSKGCITISRNNRFALKLADLHFKDCHLSGLYGAAASIRTLKSLRFSDMRGAGLTLHPNAVGSIKGSFKYQNTKYNRLLTNRIDSNFHSAKITRSATWHKQSIPWRAYGDIIVSHARNRPVLTLHAGVQIAFKRGGLQVGRWQAGGLQIKGSAKEPVILRGFLPSKSKKQGKDKKSKAIWNGLHFGRWAFASRVQHLQIQDAGHPLYNHSQGCITVSYNGRFSVKLEQIHMRNCFKSGLYLQNRSAKIVRGLRFSNMHNAGMTLHPNAIRLIQESSIYKNVRFNRIISGVINSRFHSQKVTDSGVWTAQAIPWRAYGDIIIGHDQKHPVITIKPGVHISFLKGGLQVGTWGYGKLIAKGRPSQPILLTLYQPPKPKAPTPTGAKKKALKQGKKTPQKHWNGLFFGSWTLRGSILEHVHIKDAGNTKFQHSKAAITLYKTRKNLTINKVFFFRSHPYSVWKDCRSKPSIENNQLDKKIHKAACP